MKKILSKGLISLLMISAVLLTSCNNSNDVTNSNNKTEKSTEINNNKDTFESSETSKSTQEASKNSVVKGKKVTNSIIYNVIGKEYFYKKKGKSVEVKYPKVTNFNNKSLQKQINQLIKNEALKPIKNYIDNNKNFNITVGYEISFNKDKFISIKYKGLFSSNKNAYPINLFYTCTIDMVKAKVMNLKDIINVNESFLKLFKKYGNIVNNSSSKELKEAQKSELQEYKIDDLKETESYVYLTDNLVGISIQVPHAIGDHMEVEVGYKELEDIIKIQL